MRQLYGKPLIRPFVTSMINYYFIQTVTYNIIKYYFIVFKFSQPPQKSKDSKYVLIFSLASVVAELFAIL